MKELRESLKNGSFYDYIANNYYSMTKDQLKELILNLDWVATECMDDDEVKGFYGKLEDELDNRDFFN